MKDPSLLKYIVIILASLLFALAGLYLLIHFKRIFRGSIKNEWLRRNAAAWLIIFCISVAMIPLSGGFFYAVERYGWWCALGAHVLSATLCTLIIFNSTRAVAENNELKKFSFLKHNVLILLTLVLTTLAINIPFSAVLYNGEKRYIKFSVVSSIYIGAATGLVYAVIRYLDIERQRKIDEKELELSRLRELKTKAELDALHSKINPHFLYNALNSIADLAITDGKKGRKMTIALADLFRYSINYSNNNFSTIKDEVEMANVYLQIEKIRFEDQLNYSLEVEEELNDYLVPRFVLQPLVENAVKHGLKTTGQMTEINLQVKKKSNGFVINIADTGPVFPQELIPGYGVKSVYDKLDLLFPGQYEMHFSNLPVKQVSLHIHKLMKDESAL
ncbi:MAG: histidine kinase [Ferruginibacter sp.]|nr:histidine kinase [Chitinophagaceae bacterium]